ncbi:MAG: hypothetical protein C0624_06205 [Desulfuromonas sp.]|nr:MAG: hypothetical protein C0624_06205 [Desulfuromonas sp.]
MSGSVNAELTGDIIHVVWSGTVDMPLLIEGQEKILTLLAHRAHAKILHNTLSMDDPCTSLALKMRQFDMEIKDRVDGIATVVKSPKTAVMAKISFAFSKKHQVYRDNLEAAKSWLSSC